MADFILKRFASKYNATLGNLYLPSGEWICFTLEDVEREEKIFGETAIPCGRYEIDMTYSPKFQMVLPEILDVPNFRNIRIHAGNTPHDSQGCILVGMGLTTRDHMPSTLSSRDALNILLPEIEREIGFGKMFIDIISDKGNSLKV
jgi:hypothetical protein